MDEKLRVLVVDDATFMIKAVSEILDSDPAIEVVGSARNGLEGLEKVKQLRPDVITLDIDMPVMDGIKAVKHIMINAPVPIVILSSLFKDGSITFEALRLGVVDFLPKPSGAISTDIHNAKQQIIDRVKIAASIKIHNIHRAKLDTHAGSSLLNTYGYRDLESVIAIGTSLGGPNTVIRLLTHLSPDLPAAVLVTQEISTKILSSFVSKFDEYVPWKVVVAEAGQRIEPGTCYVCSNEQTLTVSTDEAGNPVLMMSPAMRRPLNAMFQSVSEHFGSNAIGVLLTGVGDDGADGFAQIKEGGGITIAQDTDTCVYPNLTQCAIERGTVDYVVDEANLAEQIETCIRGH